MSGVPLAPKGDGVRRGGNARTEFRIRTETVKITERIREFCLPAIKFPQCRRQ